MATAARYGAFVADPALEAARLRAEGAARRTWLRRRMACAFLLGCALTVACAVAGGVGRETSGGMVDVKSTAAKKKKSKVAKIGVPTLGPPLYNRSTTLSLAPLIGGLEEPVIGTHLAVGPLEIRWETQLDEHHFPPGFFCTQIRLPTDITPTKTWNDNYICTSINLHLKWSVDGPVDDMDCVRVADAQELGHVPDAADQYLCKPSSIPYDFIFSQKLKDSDPGPQDDLPCLHLLEPHDPVTWSERTYLCVVYAAAETKGGETFTGLNVNTFDDMTLATCSLKCAATVQCKWFEFDTEGANRGTCWLKKGVRGSRGIMPGHMYGVPFRCGDGMSNTIDETCDDGNTEDGDGCSSECQQEDGYSCTQRTDGVSNCLHIAQCAGPYVDRCNCELPAEFCAGRFKTGAIKAASATIYDFYTCQACCADGVHACALDIATCDPATKPKAQACNRKCLDRFGGSRCPDDHGKPWWERLPTKQRAVAGSYEVIAGAGSLNHLYLTGH